MATINPYLNFNGKTEEAFNFYKSVFGGEFLNLQRFRDIPDSGQIPEAELDLIMHVSLPIGESILMGSDAPESMGFSVKTGNNVYVAVSLDSRGDADRVFNAISVDGKIEMPMSDMFWGSYFGSLADKYGVLWMISFEKKEA